MNNDSAISTVERCLERIREFDGRIRAWEHVDEEGARSAARILDEQAAAGSRRGPLHGIPIGIKDIIDVAGMPTRAGSPLRAGHMATEDAPVVAALRAAGAVILGKTVTCEFACFDPAPTRNPWNLEHTPGGSSAGSAAAVAAGMCWGAVGSQTGGSVIRPAAYCGVAGFKPTFDAVSRQGVVPVSDHLDHVGFLGNMFALASIMAHCTVQMNGFAPRLGSFDWSRLDVGPRLCVLGGMFHERADTTMRRMLHTAVERLRSTSDELLESDEDRRRIRAALGGRPLGGARIEYRDAPAGIEDALHHHRVIMAHDAAQYHQAAFADRPEAFGPKISALIQEGLAVSAAEYQASLDHQRHYATAMDPMFEAFDAFVMPATPTTAPGLETTGDPSFNAPWSYVGLPAATIPCGRDERGLPAGLQLVGARWGDVELTSVATWCELRLGLAEAAPL